MSQESQPSNSSTDSAPTTSLESEPSTQGDLSADTPDIEPMTFSLLGRFFLVPLLIIGTIVSGAVLVVLLFGGPSAPQERSLRTLLQSLEASSGDRSLGILLPREKELWQTALELSVRLKEKDTDPSFDEVELADVADRLASMIAADLRVFNRFSNDEAKAENRRDIRARRLEFLIRALGRTQQPTALSVLIQIVRDGREPFVQVALQELVELRTMPGARSSLEPISALLSTARTDETLLVACTALSVLATADDDKVIEALRRVRLRAEGDVAWSAALALARLGSDAGKSTLMDLLDRSFLESGDRFRVAAPGGTTVHRYKMPPQRVDEILMAAVDAASNLEDEDLWDMIERLKSDTSPAVRGRAVETLEKYGRLAFVPPSEQED